MKALRFLDYLWLLAVTIAMEAGGESDDGKRCVAFVVVNRARASGESISDVIFKKFQFSCWNTDAPTRMNLDTMDEGTFAASYAAAVSAYFGLVSDPTGGATHYLNEELTRKIRGDGTLPKWFDPARVTRRVERHTFLRLA